MLLVLESSDTMASLPIVNKYFSVFGLVAERPRQATVIFVRVSQNDAPNITDRETCGSQRCAQGIHCFPRFRTRIDDRYRIFFDEINIYRPDVERCRK